MSSNVSVSLVCLEFSQLFAETNLTDSRNEPMIFARLQQTTPNRVFPRFTLSGRGGLFFPAWCSQRVLTVSFKTTYKLQTLCARESENYE